LVELNEDILQTGLLEKIVLTVINRSVLPSSFDLYHAIDYKAYE
jgi:hypothetical protein